MKTSVKLISIAFTTAVTVFGTAAMAAQLDKELIFTSLKHDDKVHAGSFCQPLVGSQANRINTVSFGVENIGPFATSLTCPIVRDNVLNTNGTLRVLVRVYNPGGTLPCTLFSFNGNRNAVATNSFNTTTVGDQTQILDVNNSVSGGQYSMICTLPKGGRIYNYWVQEFKPTDPN